MANNAKQVMDIRVSKGITVAQSNEQAITTRLVNILILKLSRVAWSLQSTRRRVFQNVWLRTYVKEASKIRMMDFWSPNTELL